MLRSVKHYICASPTGTWHKKKCGSPTCSHIDCRALAIARTERAMRNSLRRANHTYLLTVTHLPTPESVKTAYHASIASLRKKSPAIQGLLVVERHKSNGMYHGHIAVASPVPLTIDDVDFKGKGRLWMKSKAKMNSYSGAHLVRLPAYSIAHYMTKEPRRACKYRDNKRYIEHLRLNAGRGNATATKAFYRSSGGKKEANAKELLRSRAYRQMSRYLSREVASSLTQFLVDGKQILMLLALIKKNDRLFTRCPSKKLSSSPMNNPRPRLPVLAVRYPLRL